MSQSRKTLLAALIFAIMTLTAVTSARADGLTLTLSNPTQSIDNNGTATFFGTLTNTGLTDLNIGTPGFTLPGQRVPYSYRVTILSNSCNCGGGALRYGLTDLNNPLIPTSLASMSTTGEIRLFDLSWGGANQPLTVTGMLTINFYVSGAGGPVQSVSQNFTLNVAPVPEPTTIFLLGTGLAGLASKGYRRARKRRDV